MKKEEIILKGTKDGLLVCLNSQGKFADLKTKLRDRLRQADDFLTGASVTIDLGAQSLSEVELGELQQICSEFGLTLKRILGGPTGSARSLDGASSVEQSSNGRKNVAVKSASSAEKPQKAVKRRAKDAVKQTTPEVVTATDNPIDNRMGYRRDDLTDWMKEQEIANENTVLIQRTLRSGQSIQYPGNVVILGDVNPGAEVIASGNIVVMGCFRGVAHAGATGNEQAIVTAFRLKPTQLRIANHITRAPDGEYPEPDQPEIARIRDGMVVIEKY
ncbi:MAG: septum site-determining protein MinC [Firmicutes bacterium]|nr:septum site-determining protein MinC [Bacillota bacterium]